MKLPAALAARLNRSWIWIYTLGLGAEPRAERLAEVNSDLWEHEVDDQLNGVAGNSPGGEMLIRLVSGMPADVAWRFEQRSAMEGGKDMLAVVQKNSWQRNGLWGLSVVLIGFLLVTGVGIAIGMEDSTLAVKLGYGSAVFVSGLLILAGFVLTERQPKLGVALLVGGAVLGSALMWWFLFIPPVVALVVAIFGVRRARRFMAESSPNPQPPSAGAHA